ncbi:nucleotidyltransferase domain-containing protein [Cellulomonas xiejunii]|uniref:nucleotidyltransferase domain-containing protein n=1 Tax=Cellulomonas xiejunii TaxID=2968083 RepID=UPI001D0ECECD|nr:nucleotidyltransferase domain-containing protein [Cellulomonas xiejunii]MCC2313606.1 nucleotidyltransferase domain-containing protein [Cellulomonas xiejunii]
MTDPDEGVAADGTIRTGARRDRVPAVFEDVLTDAVDSVGGSGASLYLYGSVATGTARPGSSDVDLLSIDLTDASAVARRLSTRYADRCRGVEVAAAASGELAATPTRPTACGSSSATTASTSPAPTPPLPFRRTPPTPVLLAASTATSATTSGDGDRA